MSLPEQPASVPPATPPEQPWTWRLLDTAGVEVQVPAPYADQRFPSQADAESWVGEIWAELAAHGVDAVTLVDGERLVYGPMSLHA